MNPDMLWQLLDTSIKMGIGALLTALLAVFFFNRRHSHQRLSGPDQRRLELLETISADVGNVSHIFAKYSALATEAIRYGDSWPETRKQELEQVNIELVTEFKKLSDAESKLLMLGEKALEKTLKLYGGKIANFRRQVYVGRTDLKDETIIAMKKDINLLREQFYIFLSKKYDRLLTAS